MPHHGACGYLHLVLECHRLPGLQQASGVDFHLRHHFLSNHVHDGHADDGVLVIAEEFCEPPVGKMALPQRPRTDGGHHHRQVFEQDLDSVDQRLRRLAGVLDGGDVCEVTHVVSGVGCPPALARQPARCNGCAILFDGHQHERDLEILVTLEVVEQILLRRLSHEARPVRQTAHALQRPECGRSPQQGGPRSEGSPETGDQIPGRQAVASHGMRSGTSEVGWAVGSTNIVAAGLK